MTNKRTLYAKKLQTYYMAEQEDRERGNQLSRKLWLKQLHVTEHFTRDFVADVHTNRRGVAGKLVLFIKRIFRKGTFYIFKQFSERIYDFQSRSMELSGDIIQALLNLEEQQRSFEKDLKALIERQTTLISKFEERQNQLEIEQSRLSEKLWGGGIMELKTRLDEYSDQMRMQQAALLLRNTEYHLMFTGRNNGMPSYSQCGEDGVLNYLLFTIFRTNPKEIRYLDIGCNNYKDDNNTYFFYLCGASGVVIDANPRCIEAVKNNRSRDIALNIGVGPEDSENATFYIMENYGLSTFSEESVKDMIEKNKENQVAREIEIPIVGINTILNRYFTDRAPEILSIDAEGMDAAILQAMDFETYRPKLVIVETIDYAPWVVVGQKREDILKIMANHGYKEFAFTGVNSIFIDPVMLQ